MSADTVFADLSSELAEAGVSTGQLFGFPALLVHDTAFACLHNDSIALQLGDGSDAQQLALGLPGATVWDPSGQQHPFADWVAVPIALNAELEETQIGDLAPAAMAFLAAPQA